MIVFDNILEETWKICYVNVYTNKYTYVVTVNITSRCHCHCHIGKINLQFHFPSIFHKTPSLWHQCDEFSSSKIICTLYCELENLYGAVHELHNGFFSFFVTTRNKLQISLRYFTKQKCEASPLKFFKICLKLLKHFYGRKIKFSFIILYNEIQTTKR